MISKFLRQLLANGLFESGTNLRLLNGTKAQRVEMLFFGTPSLTQPSLDLFKELVS